MTQTFRALLLATVLFLPLPALAAGQSQVSQDYVTILENRLAALEQQVQNLTNQTEQANYQARMAQEKVQRLQEDIDARFRMMQSTPAADGQGNEPQQQQSAAPSDMRDATATLNRMTSSGNAETGAGATELPDDVNHAYDQAFSLVRDGDYEAAEAAMRAFLKRWPRNDLSSNAAYWLGETFYVRGDFSSSAKAFAEGYQKYPKGAKAEDTLLKLGLSLASLNRARDACITFDQLTAEFPRLSATNRRRVEQERSQLNCVPAQQQGSSESRSATTSSSRRSPTRPQR